MNVKYDLTWQINKAHSIKTGLLYTAHQLHNKPIEVQNKLKGTPLANYFEYDSENQKVVFYCMIMHGQRSWIILISSRVY